MNYNETFKQIAQYRAIKAEAESELAKLEQEIKDYMLAEGIDTLQGDEHKATYKQTASTSFDKDGIIAKLAEMLSEDAGEVKAQYTKPNPSMRFTFA